MALNTTTQRVDYAGDGSTIVFPITFKFFNDTDIVVAIRESNGDEVPWVLGTQYTLTGAGEDPGGDLTVITLPVDYTPQTGQTLVIKRVPPEVQATVLPSGGPLPSKSIEDQLDYVTMLVQTHSEEIARSLVFSETSAASGVVVEDPVPAQFTRWSADGQKLESADITGSGSIGIPVSIAEGGTSATTAAGARTNLGLVIGSDVNEHMETVSEAEAKAGTATDRRAWSSARVREAATAVLVLPRGHLAGLGLSNDTGDPAHDIAIVDGECRNDANNENMVLQAPLVKSIDAAWAVGTGQGGLDTGAVVADTWYHVFLIKRTSTLR